MESAQIAALLPPWLQVVVSILMFGTALYAYFSGIFKKLPQNKQNPDTAVPVVSTVSAQAIENWVAAIKSSQSTERERLDLLRELLFIIRAIDERLESIDHRIKYASQNSNSVQPSRQRPKRT